MKKILFGLATVVLGTSLLTGCGSTTTSNEVQAAENKTSSEIYVEVYQQKLNTDEEIVVFYNKKNGCVNEVFNKVSYRGGGSWKEVLDSNDETPVCGISEQEARDMYRP